MLDFKDKTLVILGGTGLLGQALCKCALDYKELNVRSVARKGADDNLDVTNVQQLIEYLERIRPTHIINAVAQVNLEACEKDPGQAYIINAGVTGHLASYCYKNRTKLCYISTDHYFTGDKTLLHDEDTPVTLLNEYAKTKYAGEHFALTYPKSLVIRTNIVGFRGWKERPTFVEWVIEELKSGREITAYNDFYTSSLDVTTCAKAVLDLLFLDVSGIINVASRECVSKEEFIRTLAKRLNLDISNLHSGSLMKANTTVRRAESLGLDVSQAESFLRDSLPKLNEVIDNIAHEHKARA